jgi:hypothetical protein
MTQEYRLNTGRLVRLPAASKWSDFDNRHAKELHFPAIHYICSLEHDRAK